MIFKKQDKEFWPAEGREFFLTLTDCKRHTRPRRHQNHVEHLRPRIQLQESRGRRKDGGTDKTIVT